MTRRVLALVLTITAILAPGLTRAQDSAATSAPHLRPEWNIETARPGRAYVVGYLYNTSGTMDAALNVLLRVDQLTHNGQVSKTQLAPVFGDVRARGRLAFEVPISTSTPTVRVVVESVDWVLECR